MAWQLLISGFLLGIVSSFHCVGMCGPIAFSLPVYYLPTHKKMVGILLYHTGRIAIYACLGVLFGFVGRQFFLGGGQQVFSIILGTTILLILVQSQLRKRKVSIPFFDKFQGHLQQFIGNYIRKKQLYAMFVLGMANGLLPCGMVYLAITGALAAGTIIGGLGFMTAFGMGTVPALLILSFFGSVIGLEARNTMKKAIPYFVAIMGVLLILRGLNLNIPLVSPLLKNSSEQAIPCP
jgi:sulfite exporter TauE/SafE